jgi:cytochrome c peroxidase
LRARTSIFLTLVFVPTYIWLVTVGARNFFPLKFAQSTRQLSGITKLGEFLFDDKNLSEPKGQACASCHDPKLKRQGNNGSTVFAVAAGSRPEVFGNRNVPTIMYDYDTMPFHIATELSKDSSIEYIPMGGLFLDGRADSLQEQAKAPMLNHLEMNNPSFEAVVAKVRASSYAGLAVEIFGPKVFEDPNKAINKFAEAIAAYEKTSELSPFSSKFDNYLRGRLRLSQQEKIGFELFKNPAKGNCIACHAGKIDSKEPEDWLFTDFTYDVLGAPRNKNIPANADPKYFDLGLCKRPSIEKKLPAGFDIGKLCGAFKVPTLRNLTDAVEFYVTRDVNPERWYPKNAAGEVEMFNDLPKQYHSNVNTTEAPYDRKRDGTARLNSDEIAAIVTFLETLTDEPDVE